MALRQRCATCGRFGSEDPQCGSGDEVALKVAGVVNSGVHAEEALGRSSRLEPLQLTLAVVALVVALLDANFPRVCCA
jgi:hypothetical protein